MDKDNTNPFRLALAEGLKNPILGKACTLIEPHIERASWLGYLADKYDEFIKEDHDESKFCEKVFEKLSINIQIDKEELARIPESGPAVVVSNHPFGGLEGVILIYLLSQRRKDFKVLANYLLGRIPQIKKHFIFVDPFGSRSSTRKNTQPLREAIEYLKNDGMLATFPSGTVSHFQWKSLHVSDPNWNINIARIVRRAKVPVIPMFFEGRNGNFFQCAGLIHPILRTLLLPRELANKQGKTIQVRVGNQIPWSRIADFSSDKELISYLRLRTYILGGPEQHEEYLRKKKKKEAHKAAKKVQKQEEIIAPVDTHLLKKEFSRLPFDQILIENKDYMVVHAQAYQIPSALREIGRLREITFRAAAEGSGKSLDIDRFDNYYTHLVIWNKSRKEIVGAYRVGKVADIIPEHGINGLYTSTLFAYKKQLIEQLGSSLEAGRSFVRLEYQRSYAALDLLWRGIGHFVAKNPECNIIFGTVSISTEYSSVSRMLIASFLKQNSFIPEFASLIKPRNPFKAIRVKGIDSKTSSLVVKNLEDVNELLKEVELKHHTIPILVKQYLRLGGKFLGFNIDPDFGDVLDGLIYIDLAKTQPKLLDRYLGKEGCKEFLEYHSKS